MTKSKGLSVIVGLGKTGLSVAKYLLRNNRRFAVMDSNSEPPELAAIKRLDKRVEVYVGGLNKQVINAAEEIILSPGTSPAEAAIAAAMNAGVPVIGDIELFARELGEQQRIVAVTGTNGKSTVSHLICNMARNSGVKVALGGNVGIPVLDLLDGPLPELFVLELSSFQLETTFSLRTDVAVILNVTNDHLDRHLNFESYVKAKARILDCCGSAVIGRNCERLFASRLPERTTTFGDDAPKGEHFGLIKAGDDWEIHQGKTRLLAAADISSLPGIDGLLNAQAALAAAAILGLPRKNALDALNKFRGLAHRYRKIGTLRGATWIDDSKATNVASALAALRRARGRCVWIAGGVAKGTDFASLAPTVKRRVRNALLIGSAASQIAEAIGNSAPISFCADLPDAARQAALLAQAGDRVLLAPACSSLDMFADYADRGRCFAEAFAAVRDEYFARNENDKV